MQDLPDVTSVELDMDYEDTTRDEVYDCIYMHMCVCAHLEIFMKLYLKYVILLILNGRYAIIEKIINIIKFLIMFHV